MLNDSLKNTIEDAINEVCKYSSYPYDKKYSQEQEQYIVLGLYNLEMARMRYDNLILNKVTTRDKMKAMKKIVSLYKKAIEEDY